MNQELADLLQKEVTKLNPSPVIELYELDMTPCGPSGERLYFHNGTGGFAVPISFMGISYTPIPIMVRGFELTGTGEPTRPTLSILNAGGFMSAVVLKLDDLVGAILVRRRTFARFLDGETEAAPVQYPEDIYRIVQKTREDRLLVEFELGSGLDLDGVRFPIRTIVATYCQHVYRGLGCRFGGRYVVADSSGGSIPAPGILNFRETWFEQAVYHKDDSVWFESGGDGGLYQCIISADATVSGPSDSPTDPTKWKQLQHWRGLFDSTATYVTNDVVQIDVSSGPQMYLAIRSVPMNIPPPNLIYWHVDSCGKSFNHCRWRFDPLRKNRVPLPFGGFPGVTSIPDG